MAFLGLCQGDPLVEMLRAVFDANIVRVPEERVQPLSVVATRGERTAWQGQLAELLHDPLTLNLKPDTSRMAGLTGKRSRRVQFDFGVQILEGFLSGFGIPPGGIETALAGATDVSFAFNNVRRLFIDRNMLGSVLRGQRIDRTQPSAAIYFGHDPWSLLVIDSTIQSSSFTLHVDKSSSKDFKIDAGALQRVIGEANTNAKISSASGRAITLAGSRHLTFAFTCVRMYLDEQGRITDLPDEPSRHVLKALEDANQSEHQVRPGPVRVMLTSEPAMLSWDDIAAD